MSRRESSRSYHTSSLPRALRPVYSRLGASLIEAVGNGACLTGQLITGTYAVKAILEGHQIDTLKYGLILGLVTAVKRVSQMGFEQAEFYRRRAEERRENEAAEERLHDRLSLLERKLDKLAEADKGEHTHHHTTNNIYLVTITGDSSSTELRRN